MLDSDGNRVPNGKNIEIHIPQEDVENATVREIIARIARVTGTNAVFNRNNRLEFRQLRRMDLYSVVKNVVTKYDAYAGDWKATVIELPQIIIDAKSRYYTFSKEGTDARIVEAFVECGDYIASTRLIARYPYGTGVTDMTFTLTDDAIQNNSAAIEVMKSLYYHNMQPLKDYMPGSVGFIGDPSLQVGDVIVVQDMDGKMHSFPIMQNIIEYDGGVKNTCAAYAQGYGSDGGCYAGSDGGIVAGIQSTANPSAQMHKHANKSVLDKITEEDYANWNAADTVAVTCHLKTGIKIAEIDVSGVLYDVYAPESPAAEQIAGWNEAAESVHIHSNKAILDGMTASFTAADKTKLDSIAAGANKTTVDTALSTMDGW